MGAAERALRSRQREIEAARLREHEALAASTKRAARELVAEIEPLRAQVLIKLASAGYPYSRSVDVKALVGFRTRTAWELVPFIYGGEEQSTPGIYMLSDGRLTNGSRIWGARTERLDEIDRDRLAAVRDGLTRLLKQLG